MAQPRLIQLSVAIHLFVLAVTAVSSQLVYDDSKRLLDFTATNCSLGPLLTRISCANLGLKDVPLDLFPDVEELDISLNQIKHLLNSSFSPYRRLKNLSLYSNEIRKIDIGSFFSLLHLENLDLRNNNLKKVTSEMFRCNANLTYLSFYHNMNLRFFPGNMLRWLHKLQMLDLGWTQISKINITTCNSELVINLENTYITSITNKTFVIDCELKSLYLKPFKGESFSIIDPHTVASIRSRILSIRETIMPPDMWQRLFTGIGNTEIEELLLQDEYIGDTDAHYFAPLRKKTLHVLDLRRNNLRNLTKMGFLDLPRLHTLILDWCNIKIIGPGDFSGMKGLRVLRLNFNSIKKIGDSKSNQSWDIDLEELYLASNPLHSIDPRSFAGLFNLKILVLSGSFKLHMLSIPDTSGLRSLQYLDLTRCSLDVMLIKIPNLQTFILNDCEGTLMYYDYYVLFNYSRSIKHLSLQKNGFDSFLVYDQEEETTVSLFKGLRSLISLDVKNNPVKVLQSGVFMDLIFLNELDLSSCKLEQIEYKTFSGLRGLKTLYLQDNNLHQLADGIFRNMGQLTAIHLGNNKLRYLESDLFANSSKLLNLSLAGNRLSTFNRSTFQPIFSNLIYINISDNELTCTCNLKWLPTWLAGSIKLLSENDTRCSSASLTTLQEKPLMSFDPAKLCAPNIALYCSILLLMASIVVVVVVAYRHRWLINYKLFLLKLAVVGYQEIQDARDFDDFEFHFNIMFAEEDEGWVENHLRPALEERLPEYNRNVYGDNNLPLGMHYCDAVHYVVEMSYKTIVLVSRAAIQDNWFVIKFRTAADQVNDTQVENMVVIFLEDIPDDELPFLVRLYLSDRKPYLGWEEEEDQEFQDYFWQKLTKMLTINLRSNNVIPPE